MRLPSRDVRALSRLLLETYALRDLAAVGAHLTAALPALIRCDSLSYNEIDLRRKNVVMIREPSADPRLYPAFVRHFTEHPGYRRFTQAGETGAVRLSDHLSRRAYHRMALYNEYYNIATSESSSRSRSP